MHPFSALFSLVVLSLLPFSDAPAQTVAAPDAETVLSTLDRAHPRLILKNADIDALKKRAESDTVLRRMIAETVSRADTFLGKPRLEHVLVGPRLLSVSRNCLERVYALGLAWRFTGEEKYARAAEENLLTVCAFPDWNPSHFLDTAEMSHAVGIGYDWLYPFLGADSRERIRRGLIELGMKPGVAAYTKENGPAWWAKSEFNWNQVCNGGLSVGALAIAETDPEYARVIVPAAVKSLPLALGSYAPDGAWGEGPGYWDYATRYVAYGLSAMVSALGTDYGLSKAEGLAECGLFPVYTTGPTGLFLNFADSGEKSNRGAMPAVFWVAKTFGNQALADNEHALMRRTASRPQHLLWYMPESGNRASALDLDRRFRGKVDLAVFRSGWGPDDIFVGVKGGYNQVNHGHLDPGNFELDALGVRWARDLGSDDYNLPGYWDGKKGGQRWTYYRLNSLSHSVPLIDGRNQDENARAEFVSFVSQPSGAHAVIDLTTAYAPAATRAVRGVALVEGRRSVLVEDEFDLAAPATVTWAMTTDAEIALDGALAVLTLGGKTLDARILSPKGAKFTVESAARKAPEKTNKGVRRLLVPVAGKTGPVRIAVQLSPRWTTGKKTPQAKVYPLSKW